MERSKANKTLAIFSNGDPFESSTWSNDSFLLCHGYLRRDVDREAMALGTPVIVSPNIELERMIGDMDCERWCELTAEGVLTALEYLSDMVDTEYIRMCRSAFEKAREWTWGAFVERWCSSVGL